MSTIEPPNAKGEIEFRVTFGQRYARAPHPTLDTAHPDGWLAVMATDEMAAREKVFGLVGPAWAFIYHPHDDDYPGPGGPYYPRGEIARIN